MESANDNTKTPSSGTPAANPVGDPSGGHAVTAPGAGVAGVDDRKRADDNVSDDWLAGGLEEAGYGYGV
jgi:hypothetical protein